MYVISITTSTAIGPNPLIVTGTIHHVQCADLDGSGVDSIIVACMGYRE